MRFNVHPPTSSQENAAANVSTAPSSSSLSLVWVEASPYRATGSNDVTGQVQSSCWSCSNASTLVFHRCVSGDPPPPPPQPPLPLYPDSDGTNKLPGSRSVKDTVQLIHSWQQKRGNQPVNRHNGRRNEITGHVPIPTARTAVQVRIRTAEHAKRAAYRPQQRHQHCPATESFHSLPGL